MLEISACLEIGSCLRSEADIERWVQRERERESNQSEKMGREIEREGERENVKGSGEK